MKLGEGAEPSDPQEINWDEIQQQCMQKIKEWAEANGQELTEEQLEEEAHHVNNFHQYFPMAHNGRWLQETVIDGHLQMPAQDVQEKTTMRERLKQLNKKTEVREASGPKDFDKKYSKEFLDTSVAQFFDNLDEALKLAGLNEEDFKNYTFIEVNSPETFEEKIKLVARAYQYLIATKRYNHKDLGS